MSPPEIFDRRLRRLRRDRAARGFAGHDFLRRWMIDGIADRLAAVRRDFTDALDLGCFDQSLVLPAANVVRADAGAAFARGGVQGDEDHPAFPDASFDLIVSAGVLDTVNDLPGALVLIRRALRPDGLFLGAFFGAGSLVKLRRAFQLGEAERPVARLHPQIDVRYADLFALIADLRGMAATNMLVDREPMTRAGIAGTARAFAGLADADGRVSERAEVVFVTGWRPA